MGSPSGELTSDMHGSGSAGVGFSFDVVMIKAQWGIGSRVYYGGRSRRWCRVRHVGFTEPLPLSATAVPQV